jgi:2'-5' RNA ligase
MTSPASVAGDDPLRLFVALRLPEEELEALAAWQMQLPASVRVVPRQHLHVTLAFLGGRPARELAGIVAELRAAAGEASPEVRLTVSRYRETRCVAMLVLDDEGGRATALAEDVQGRLQALGVYRGEGRPWLPHLTVARFREQPRLRLEPPKRTFVPSDAAAYLSRLRPGGAQYEVLASAALGRS